MNAVTDIQQDQPGTALTIIERARIALKSQKTEADFKALVEQSQSITAITNTDGRTQCHARLMDLVKARTGLDAVDEEARKDLVAVNKAIIAERKRLGSIIEDEEKRLRALRDEWDKKIAAEKKAKDEAEAKRRAVIQERIDEIRQAPEQMTGQPSKVIAERIERLKVLAIDDATFAESKSQAEGAKATALVRLDKLHAAAVAHEAAQKKLEEERAELERQKAEERRVAAIRKRIEAISAYANNLGRLKSAEIDRLITEVGRIEIDAGFEELANEAQQARTDTLVTLSTAYEDRKAQEAEAERLAREKAEQDAAAAKERARIAEEERQAAARRAEEQRRHDEQLRRQREEEEAQAAERRRILKAEEAAAAQRIADQQAELDRQRQALQVSQETVVAPSDPVEAVDGERVEPAPVVSPETAQTSPRWRPRDEAIVHVVATTWNVSEAVATGWLLDFADRVRAKGEAA